jgi:hypothetical protein
MDALLAMVVTLFVGVAIVVAAINAETIKENWSTAKEVYANSAYHFQELWQEMVEPLKGLTKKTIPMLESLGYDFGDLVKFDEDQKYYMVLTSGVWVVTQGSPLLVVECDSDTLRVNQYADWKYVYDDNNIVEHVPAQAVEALLDEMIERKIYG